MLLTFSAFDCSKFSACPLYLPSCVTNLLCEDFVDLFRRWAFLVIGHAKWQHILWKTKIKSEEMVKTSYLVTCEMGRRKREDAHGRPQPRRTYVRINVTWSQYFPACLLRRSISFWEMGRRFWTESLFRPLEHYSMFVWKYKATSKIAFVFVLANFFDARLTRKNFDQTHSQKLFPNFNGKTYAHLPRVRNAKRFRQLFSFCRQRIIRARSAWAY